MLLLRTTTYRGLLFYALISSFLFPNNLFAQGPLVVNLVVTSDYNGSAISCAGNCDAMAEAQISGGNAPYSILWETGTVTVATSMLCAGTYTVTVTDNLSTVIIDSIVITEPDVMVPIAAVTSDYNGQVISCHGKSDGSAIAGATGGSHSYSYLWSTSPFLQSTQAATSLSAGTYSITITDQNNCSAVTSVTLSEPDVLSISVDSVIGVNCISQTSGGLELSANGGSPSYLFEINNSNLGQNSNNSGYFSSLIKGLYQITVSDLNGCVQLDSVFLDYNDSLEVKINLLQGITCPGDNDAALGTTVVGRPLNAISFLWNTLANTGYLSDLAPSVYSVIVRDSGGCIATDT